MGIVGLSFLITAVLVFTGLFFLFRKYSSKTKPLSSLNYWVTGVFATPAIYIGILFLWLLASSSYELQEFNKESWTNNRDSRYEYVDDLINSEKLIGLTNRELEDMLGKADYEDDSTMIFYIGYTPRPFFNMDPDWLKTELIDGKVSNASVRD